MSAVALLLREKGWEITGSDEGFYPPVSDYLVRAGIPFAHGYKKEHIPEDADVIVIGKNAKLVPETNEEVAAALQSGTQIRSFPDVLEELTKDTDNIVVVGSYGKSTCAALLAWCLMQAGKDPSFFIGEITKGLKAHAHLGSGPTFILEGDEYPSSNWDASSKFLHYRPKSVLLTSTTHDHVNIFPTHADYLEPFMALMATTPPDGLVVVSAEPHAQKIAEHFPGRVVHYARSDGWHTAHIVYGMPTRFDLMKGEKKIITLETTLLGAHNIENIVGVSALLLERELLTPEELAGGVACFEGVTRRMDLLSPHSLIPVLEGYGTSKEKALSAIAAMKLHFPERRLVVVFEPHTFSWRNRDALPWYDDVFEGANLVLVYEPASQGATTHAQSTHEEIVERIRASGIETFAINTGSEGLELLKQRLHENDAVLLLTSGDLGGLIKSVPVFVETQFPK